jgi:ferredoxin
MQIVVDYERCTGAGKCVVVCPEVFAQDEDGIVVLLDESPPEELRERVDEAIDVCPAACIEVED